MTRTSPILPLLLLCAAAGGAGGCVTTVRPEPRPADPVAVFLNDYGVHSSLTLPTPEGRFVEYSFGDYGYAALNHDGPHDALGALLVSGQSGIGRRFLSVRPGREDPRRGTYAPVKSQKLYVERAQVYALVRDLDRRYRSGVDAPVYNPVTDTTFVKDTERYSFANNCNHMTGRMLRELGCEVRGHTATSKFRIVGKQSVPAPASAARYAAVLPPPPPAHRTKQPSPPRRASAPAPAPSYTRLDAAGE